MSKARPIQYRNEDPCFYLPLALLNHPNAHSTRCIASHSEVMSTRDRSRQFPEASVRTMPGMFAICRLVHLARSAHLSDSSDHAVGLTLLGRAFSVFDALSEPLVRTTCWRSVSARGFLLVAHNRH